MSSATKLTHGYLLALKGTIGEVYLFFLICQGVIVKKLLASPRSFLDLRVLLFVSSPAR